MVCPAGGFTQAHLFKANSRVVGTYLPGRVQLEYIDFDPYDQLKIGEYSDQTIDQCESLCASTAGCAAFVVNCEDGPLCGLQSTETYTCKLKYSIAEYEFDNALVVLLNPYYQNQQTPFIGFDFNGNDLVTANGTYDECIQQCLDNGDCGMVEFIDLSTLTNSSVQSCWLKTINNLNWGFVSGNQGYLLPRSTVSGSNMMSRCLPCPKGAFFSRSRVLLPYVGLTSLPGSSTCYLSRINDDFPFALENEKIQSSWLGVTQDYPVELSNLTTVFVYNSNSMALYNPSTNLCLDDLGNGYSTNSSLTDYLALKPCSNVTNPNQQFVYVPLTHHIYNPNNPYSKCLDGTTSSVYMYTCDLGNNPGSDPYQRWTVIPVCAPGEFSSTGLPPCSICPQGNNLTW